MFINIGGELINLNAFTKIKFIEKTKEIESKETYGINIQKETEYCIVGEIYNFKYDNVTIFKSVDKDKIQEVYDIIISIVNAPHIEGLLLYNV